MGPVPPTPDQSTQTTRLAGFALACAVAVPLILLGHWALAAAAAVVLFILGCRNFTLPVLALAAALPYIGEPDRDDAYLSILWLIPFAWACACYLCLCLFAPGKLHVQPVSTTVYIAFLATCMLSLMVGYDLREVPTQLEGLPEVIPGLSGTHERLFRFSLSTIFFLFGMSLGGGRRSLQSLLWILTLVALPLTALLPFLNREAEVGGRSNGVFTEPAGAAIHILIAALAAYALARTSRNFWLRWFAAGTTLVLLAAQIFPKNKTVIATVPLVAFLAIVLEYGWKKAVLGVAVLGIGVALSFPFLPERLQEPIATITSAATGVDPSAIGPESEGKSDISTFRVRIIHIKRSIELWRERPLLGYGAANSMWVSQIPNDPLMAGPMIHNYYAMLLVETGLIGLTLFLLLLGVVLRPTWSILKHHKQEGDRTGFELARAIFLIMIALLINLLTVPGHTGCERHLWFFLGVMAAVPRIFPRSA